MFNQISGGKLIYFILAFIAIFSVVPVTNVVAANVAVIISFFPSYTQLLIIVYLIFFGLEAYFIKEATPFGKSGMVFLILTVITLESFVFQGEMEIDLLSYSILVVPIMAIGTLLGAIDLFVRMIIIAVRQKRIRE